MSIFDQYISVYNGVTDNVGTYTLLGNFLGSKRHISRILDTALLAVSIFVILIQNLLLSTLS